MTHILRALLVLFLVIPSYSQSAEINTATQDESSQQIKTGAEIFVGAYLLGVGYCLTACNGKSTALYIPLAGPIIRTGQITGTTGKVLWYADTAVQVFGLFTMARGFINANYKPFDPTAVVMPVVEPGLYAAQMTFRW